MAGLQDNTLRIILVGKTGSGKSATANTILGERAFDSKIAAHAVTETCQKASREWKGRKLLVVDTPGLFDTKEKLQTTCKEISRCVLASCPGPHAIILVLQLGRYTEEEQKTVALIKAVFGKLTTKHTIILFTHKDYLEGQSLEDFLAAADVALQSLIKECGNRCCAFNNSPRADDAEKEAQVQELVELIEKMVQENGGAYFSNNIYKDIDKMLKHQTEGLMKKHVHQLEKEIRSLKDQYAHQKISLQEMEEEMKSLNMKYDVLIENIRKEAENNIFAGVYFDSMFSKIRYMFWK